MDSVWTVADRVDDIVDEAVVAAAAGNVYDLLVLLLARSTFYWGPQHGNGLVEIGRCDFFHRCLELYPINWNGRGMIIAL